jgi:hypothetical protein
MMILAMILLAIGLGALILSAFMVIPTPDKKDKYRIIRELDCYKVQYRSVAGTWNTIDSAVFSSLEAALTWIKHEYNKKEPDIIEYI